MSGILNSLVQAVVQDSVTEIDGKTLNRPALLASDGLSATYSVDVDIGQEDLLRSVPIAHGNLEIVYADVGAAVRLRRSASGRFEVVGYSKRMPGTFTSIEVIIPDRKFNPQVKYQQVVSPAVREPVVVGTPQPRGWTSRRLTLGELKDFGGFGRVPLGAIAYYRNGVFDHLGY